MWDLPRKTPRYFPSLASCFKTSFSRRRVRLSRRRRRQQLKMRVALLLLLLVPLLGSGGEAQTLAQQEVEVLQQIGSKLRKDWDFSVDPCSQSNGWVNTSGLYVSNVTCDCSFNNYTLCHVVRIQLLRQNLTGVLPEEMANLTYLNYLDLSRNYLGGSIPSSWSSLPLVNLSLHANHLSGKIPKELGSLPVLKSLQLEGNQFEGPLPPELGNLRSLERLFLSANNFTGELPSTFAMLTNMTDFRIDGNGISGKIPDFIHNWGQINRIDMQGTSMNGPFPSSISLMKSLQELRVTDLSGQSMPFPQLQNSENLTELVLRNCLISGEIPPYLGTMMSLRVLDLSFNRLTGQIPSNFGYLLALEFIYLTNNMLTGEIPPWMLGSDTKNMDISYNNFSGTPPNGCEQGTINVVESFSSSKDNTISSCLRKDIPCSAKPFHSSFFINCGGSRVDTGENVYEDDSSRIGTSTFFISQSRSWAYSSTGDFVGNETAGYIARNVTVLNMTNPELYTEARLSPLSLKYYGLCLENGNYSVNLHFSETVYMPEKTFRSNGKRVFDVLIQGHRVMKDFNIEDEAGGPGRVIIKNFTASITDNTLEIHFYWAGKGTTAIPERGNYGPLISAISVTQIRTNKGLSVGALIGIIGASFLVMVFLLSFIWFRGYCQREYLKRLGVLRCYFGSDNSAEFQAQSQYYFSIKQIEAATRNFDPSNKIGEGGFGPVFKGILPDGTVIAVKQLSSFSRQGNREFLNEIGMISALRHPNLVRLYGCCIEGNELLVVYEYMENNSLGRALFGRKEQQLKLNWPTRYTICLGIARGLAYLHESRLRIVHRDIKPTNILLDKNLNPKISDFGLAKLDEDTNVSTRIAGTVGYMAPEYATRGYLTDKADVYSFGVVVLEIVSGKSNVGFMPQDKLFYLLDQANILQEQDRLIELVDPNLGSNYSKDEALRMLQVALLCTNSSYARRPGMLNVVSMLDGQAPVQAPEFVPDEDFSQSTSMKVPSLDSPRCVLKDGLSTDKSDSRCSIEEIPMNLSSTTG